MYIMKMATNEHTVRINVKYRYSHMLEITIQISLPY